VNKLSMLLLVGSSSAFGATAAYFFNELSIERERVQTLEAQLAVAERTGALSSASRMESRLSALRIAPSAAPTTDALQVQLAPLELPDRAAARVRARGIQTEPEANRVAPERFELSTVAEAAADPEHAP
jgi:hypothetical protein